MTGDNDRNPVQEWLSAACLPWHGTRAELTARYGVSTDNPYQWEIVALDVAPPPLSGMLWPFGFQAFGNYSPMMPPARLSTHVWVGNNPDENVKVAADQVGQHLGFKTVAAVHNTMKVLWQSGTASVTLTAWPERLETMPRPHNPAHERDHRLKTACSVELRTGWRRPLTDLELAWLDSFVPMGPTRNWETAQLQTERQQIMFAEPMLEFMRDLPHGMAKLEGRFGLSANGEALIFCRDALYLIPLVEISKFEVIRTLPAKGGGGSLLVARCITGYSVALKNVTVAEGDRADDLNETVARLAAATGKPFALGEYGYDA